MYNEAGIESISPLWVLTAGFAIVAFLLALVNLFFAGRRGWLMSVLRLGTTILSAIVAIPVTKGVADLAADKVYGYILPHLGEELEGFLVDVPVGAEGMRVMAALLASPVLYLLVFLLLRILLGVVLLIVEKCILPLRRPSLRLLSMPLGGLNGLLITAVVFVPLCGYLLLGASLLDTMVDSGLTETTPIRENLMEELDLTEEELVGISRDIRSSHVVVGVHTTVGKPIFAGLTRARLDASDTHGCVVRMDLEKELTGLLRTGAMALDAAQAFKNETYTEEDKAGLVAAADSLMESDWVRLLATDALVALAENWLEDQAFLGLERPELDATMEPVMDRLLVILSDETQETLEEDIRLLLGVVGDLKINRLLSKDGDYTDMVRRMGESGLLSEVLSELEQNRRLHPLAVELKELAIRLVSRMLGVDRLQSGEYQELMGTVADTLTASLSLPEEERDALLRDSVKQSFAGQGYHVPDEVVLKMSHEMMDSLGADGEITGEELTEYLVGYAEQGMGTLPTILPELP